MTYVLIALSFAISSLWFIHKRGLAKFNVTKYSIMFDISYIIIVTLIFPIVLVGWLINPEIYITRYGKYLSNIIKEKTD